MPWIADMKGVTNHGSSDEPVELWRDDDTGRLVIRAYKRGPLDLDLLELFDWCASKKGLKLLTGLTRK